MATSRIRVITKDGNGKTNNEYFIANPNRVGFNKSMNEQLFSQIDQFGRKIAQLKTDTYNDSVIELNISINEELG